MSRLKLACLLAFASAAAYADAPPPGPSPEAAIAQGFGQDHGDCLEWTDGCVICRRLEGAEPACSTPGVACQPGDVACRVSRESGLPRPN